MKKSIINTKEPQKILIVKPSALGDVIHSLPFLYALKSRFPNAAIHWVIAKGLEGLLSNHPLIDKLWIINKGSWKKTSNISTTIKELKILFHDLKEQNYDLVIDLQGLLRSAIITHFSKSKASVGFSDAREFAPFFYRHKIIGGKDIHAVDRYLKIAKYLDCNIDSINFAMPEFDPIPQIIKTLPDKYIVMIPSAMAAAKRWSPERFGALASILPYKSVIIGSAQDIPISEIVLNQANNNAISLCGKTNLSELMAVIKNAAFCVTNDTGPMHIAAAQNVPIAAIFGPTNPIRTGPYGANNIIIRKDLPCVPCYKRNKCSNRICLDSLTVKEVKEAIYSSPIFGLL
ncbi:MAG: glycosyltransferase family 9 protein [Nitrospirae bacterium]|nr:glycosyltransferase family 9 protein [Nitrospirota bacterium]MBF0541768.1 glycosyltransferase family 9 protein [Nitrospirota bacterium]